MIYSKVILYFQSDIVVIFNIGEIGVKKTNERVKVSSDFRFWKFYLKGVAGGPLTPCRNVGGHISDRAGGQGRIGDGRRQKDDRTACGERVRDPKTQPHRRRYQ